MLRAIVFCGFFLFFGVRCATAGNKPVRIDSQTQQRTLCGFTFSAIKDLVVVARPISEKSLKNRIDNERFDACPYWVDLNYQGLTMRLDFSSEVTLKRIKSVTEENMAVPLSFFTYDEDGWRAASEDLNIKKDAIVTHEKGNALAVSGILKRQITHPSGHDYCFGLVVIGADKYLIGLVCKPQRNQVEPLGALFSTSPVISSDR